MMKKIWRYLYTAAAIAGLTMQMAGPACAESYTASTMRLLHYDGDVEILDVEGNARFIMENTRFDSGEAMRTGSDSCASVGMDESRIVTLDEKTCVEFARKGKAMELNLQEGRLLLDVQEKLDENETLDIQTATMVVGIRGTIVYVSEFQSASDVSEGEAPQTDSDASGTGAFQAISEAVETGALTQLGVLEGTAQITFREENGVRRQLSVHAGQKVTLADSDQDGVADTSPVIETVTAQDMTGFLNDQLEKDSVLKRRVEEAMENAQGQHNVSADEEIDGPDVTENDADSGSWTWNAPVTLVAQSASKLYDGQPLMRPSDVLVYGLPAQFSIRVNASGSQTDAGTGTNHITSYTIYNRQGEDVTDHFTNIQTVSGNLTVDPAPLYVWTASAEKRYDGLPLTRRDALVRSAAGYAPDQMPWRNSSYVITRDAGSGSSGATQTFYDNEILYGICGAVWVHGTNPLTGEVREMQLLAGQKMTVHLRDDREGQSIEFVIQTITEEEIPEEILYLYADNPDLLSQACADTGWNPEKIAKQIAALTNEAGGQEEEAGQEEGKGSAGPTEEKESLKLRADKADRLMTDSANVRINIDTTITNYNDRFLGSDEAHYTQIRVDDAIRITADGSQTQVGESVNTYTIDWGSENPGNFVLHEELGTLRVTPAGAVVSTGSAYKVYDGTPLTSEEASITGLVNGETATVTATGSLTEPGTRVNTYAITWGSANSINYVLEENLGVLTVTAPPETEEPQTEPPTETEEPQTEPPTETEEPQTEEPQTEPSTQAEDPGQDAAVIFTAASAEKGYDGTPLANAYVTADGLPEGFTFIAQATGSQTDAGSSENMVSSYQILDADGEDVTDTFADITTVSGTLIVRPASMTVTTGSASKEYDGTPLTAIAASITGLTEADTKAATVRATGTITKVGTTDNTFEIDWGSAKPGNYTVTGKTGTLEVTKNTSTITFTAGSASKVFDGTPLTEEMVSAEGLPSACTYSAETSGSLTDVGSSDNPVSSFRILSADGENVTTFFSDIQTKSGTLSVDPLQMNVDLGGETFVYDGTSHYASVSGTYENGEHAGEALTISELSGCNEEIPGEADFTLISGDILHVTYLGYAYDVDRSDVWKEYSFIEGKESNYILSFINDSFTVTPASLTITTGSAEKIYDGTALTSSEVTVSGLVPSDTGCGDGDVVVTATGSQAEIGESTNTYEINWGWIWPENYTVTENLGILKVEKQKLTISYGGETLDYDGKVHDRNPGITYANGPHAGEDAYREEAIGGSDGIIITTFLLYNDDELVVTLSPPGANAGSYPITGSVAAQTGSLDHYEITVTDTIHTVRPVQAIVTTGSGTKEYDGEALISPEASITGLVDGESALVTATGSQTEVGESTNTYTIDWGATNPANYILTENLGTLKVTDAEMSNGSAETEHGAEASNKKKEVTDTKDNAPAAVDEVTEQNESEAEATEEKAAEPVTGKTEEKAAEPVTEKTEEKAAEPVTEKTEEKAAEPVTEKTEEKAAEPVTENTEEKTTEPAMEPPEETAVKSETEAPGKAGAGPETENGKEKSGEPAVEGMKDEIAGAAKKETEQKAAEPVTEGTTEMTAEPVTEGTTEMTAEPVTEGTMEMTAEPMTKAEEDKNG